MLMAQFVLCAHVVIRKVLRVPARYRFPLYAALYIYGIVLMIAKIWDDGSFSL